LKFVKLNYLAVVVRVSTLDKFKYNMKKNSKYKCKNSTV